MFSGNGNKRQRVSIDTLIGRNTRIEGNIKFSGGLHVDGCIAGNVRCDAGQPAQLGLSEHGRIEGEIRVTDIELDGTVIGDVHASGRLELGTNARIDGSVYYNVLQMAGGAAVNGKLVHEPAPDESRQRETALLEHVDESFEGAEGA
ncbi:MAG TPA: polymer-forming cytoskeletal protein [Gammaproteobacteria bacterium]|nr:polymer-forming cytoskeletal protein [Gammaproteobacteria bacterium]HET7586794.1 polymer-forming cytoskeletal protein [Gammaproteobacteria bacterium]